MRYVAQTGRKYTYLVLSVLSSLLILPFAMVSLYALALAFIPISPGLLALGVFGFFACWAATYFAVVNWYRFRMYSGNECVFHVRILSRNYPARFIALDLSSGTELEFICDRLALDLLVPNTVWDLVCYENSRFVISMVADQWEG